MPQRAATATATPSPVASTAAAPASVPMLERFRLNRQKSYRRFQYKTNVPDQIRFSLRWMFVVSTRQARDPNPENSKRIHRIPFEISSM